MLAIVINSFLFFFYTLQGDVVGAYHRLKHLSSPFSIRDEKSVVADSVFKSRALLTETTRIQVKNDE